MNVCGNTFEWLNFRSQRSQLDVLIVLIQNKYYVGNHQEIE